MALRWSDVDLDGQRIKVRRALDTGVPAARRAEVKGTKSGRARVVDIDAETVRVLKRWRAERGSAALDFTRAEAVVFGTLEGTPRNPMSVSEMFTRRVAKARKELGTEALPVITLHGLRHTHATVVLEAGGEPQGGAGTPGPHDVHDDNGHLLSRHADDAAFGGRPVRGCGQRGSLAQWLFNMD
ncbi:MAG: tyrosine-type recombinase/integrase [Actinomycetota bacterium]|nr:tyrosine-type recombinase/integrase [Actinomycetota bacterium]